jgi:hypothetical protein
MFYIGNFSDIDTDESNLATENPNLITGTHNTLQLVDITNHDQDDDGFVLDDDTPNGSSDFISYDTGAGPTTIALDSTSTYNVSVLLGDDTTISGSVSIIQAANGDVFVFDHGELSLDNINVQSITVNFLVSSFHTGYDTSHSVENSSVVCFVAGSRIATPEGDIAVEDLRPGMLVTTLDHGAQPVRWVNRTAHLKPNRNAPIILERGSLGPGTPVRKLRVSPQHRILLRSAIVKRMCGTSQVFAAAKHLLSVPGVTQALGFLPVQYHHFACANHEVVFANGAPVETFFAGAQALATLSDTSLRRLYHQIPLTQTGATPEPAQPFLEGNRLKQLIWRHQKNRRDFVEPYVVLDKSMCAG